MESLLALLNKIQQVSPLTVFCKETIIVQNAGMQHWLNMSIANDRGISLNIEYALPAQYLWKLVRNLADKDFDNEQNPFSREALCWRIYHLLATECILNDRHFSQVNDYWRIAPNETITTKGDSANCCFSEQENLKRYQLACQLADLFEQYLVFRPDWIDQWHQQKSIDEAHQNPQFQQLAQWQSTLWQFLTQEQDYNPVNLLKSALKDIASKQHLLPKRLSFFGINAMAPMWLEFINGLSRYCDVHFFHLNPCFSYWGDLLTEKQAIQHLNQWTEGFDDISQLVGNPLLANFGQQGREFLALLQQYSTVNVEVFDSIYSDDSLPQLSVLQSLQQDILSLTDKRVTPQRTRDDSIVFTSAHSPLREVQGLHDWLLHQFNNDDNLTPKDVLVMCPQVEQYAPYINAVFARGWQDLDSNIPPLPCSIADRVSKDSEPLVAAFSEIMALPDSRFHVSQIHAWLRIPSLQRKFDLNSDEIERCFTWVEQACIHWGLNENHKKQQLKSDQISPQFTWQYGLSRLIQGFAYSDSIYLTEDKVLLPQIEGSDALLLGKFLLVLEQLAFYTQTLTQKRTASQWHQFLFQLSDDLFDVNNEDNFNLISHAIESLAEFCHQAKFEQTIDLAIVQEFLNSHFSQPDPGRQFMIGQVTFCSMLPMRSIPFKVVAILGLNDGEYPRQRQPLGFDLMALSSPRLGDRSRRGDDRYLFLEALISARNTLYLSYQGRSIKNNNERQASIVLKELMEYLTLAYGWQLSGENYQDIRQLAMQPFSEKNYQGQYAGFDSKWLNLIPKNTGEVERTLFIPLVMEELALDNGILSLDCSELVSFYQHPARYFAKHKLNLQFEDYQLDLQDTEPFDCDRLASYLLRQSLVDCYLTEENTEQHASALLKQASLSGEFPDLPSTEPTLKKWQQDSITLSDFIKNDQADNTSSQQFSLELPIVLSAARFKVQLTTNVNVVNDKLVFYRSSSPKAKDFFTLYVQQLMLQIWQTQNLTLDNNEVQAIDSKALLNAVSGTHGYYFDTKNQKTSHIVYRNIPEPQQLLTQLLTTYFDGQQQALLLNGELAEKCYKSRAFKQSHFVQFWQDDNTFQAFGDDPYIQFFWHQCPELSEIEPLLNKIYQPVQQYREQIKS